MRIIPARAGPTRHADHMVSTLADHPRSCGANSARAIYMLVVSGSSPLVRGQQGSTRVIERQHRIIPARAGPTALSVAARKFSADHPRSCGANDDRAGGRSTIIGSSPLVRGQQTDSIRDSYDKRIIPARAGPTDRSQRHHRPAPDHPRSCGANHRLPLPLGELDGSSPLVRGQPALVIVMMHPPWIIPARAGPTRTHVRRERLA